MTNKRSEFGTVAERSERMVAQEPEQQRTRFVLARFQHAGLPVERPGVLLDWAQDSAGWVARVAVAADEDGTLVVRWFAPSELSPLYPRP